MKFYDFLILENEKFKQKFDSRRYRKIESIAERSLEQNDIIEFLGENLDSLYGDEQLFELKDLIVNFKQVKEFLDKKSLKEYGSSEELEQALNNLKKDMLNLNTSADVIKVYEDENYVLVYPENFTSAKLYGGLINNPYSVSKDEIEYLKEKLYGVTFYLIPKNGSEFTYKITYKFGGEFMIFDKGGTRIGINRIDRSILQKCRDFVYEKFKKIVNIFEDDYLKEKYIALNLEGIEQKAKQNQDKLRQEDAWFGTDIGNRAKAAFEYSKGYSNAGFEELRDIYDLYWDGYAEFSTEPEGEGVVFRVLNQEEADNESQQYWESYVDDVDPTEAFSRIYLNRFLDEEKIKEYFWSLMEDQIKDDLESYFEVEELPINSYDQRKIDRLKSEKDSLQQEIDNEEMSDEDIKSHQERIDEIDLEIEEIEENAEREPTSDQIEEKIDEEWYDVSRGDLIDWIEEIGLDLGDFLNTEALIKELIRDGEYGSSLSTYDGDYNYYNMDGKDYYAFRIS